MGLLISYRIALLHCPMRQCTLPFMLQAQESGEQFEIQDNVVYALDGLTSSASPAVRRESAARIAEICASRRGRLALR